MIVNNQENQYLLRNNIPYSYNLCMIYGCVYVIYFLFSVCTVFLDIIFGIIDIYNEYNCISNFTLIHITKWLLVNGLLGYLSLTLLILIKRVYTEDNFCRKLLRVINFFIILLISIWTILGIFSFFKYYYGVELCISEYPLLYNYLQVRLILSPLIIILRLFELYI
jgi:hypothetical protein